jgi:hypothetical protein
MVLDQDPCSRYFFWGYANASEMSNYDTFLFQLILHVVSILVSLPLVHFKGIKWVYLRFLLIYSISNVFITLFPDNGELMGFINGVMFGLGSGLCSIVPFYLLWFYSSTNVRGVVTAVFFSINYFLKWRFYPTLLSLIWVQDVKIMPYFVVVNDFEDKPNM